MVIIRPDPGPTPTATLGAALATASQPVNIAQRSGSSDLYVIERVGNIRRISDGELGSVDLDVSDRVVPAQEEGLLGIAFSPDGSLVYLNKASEGRTTITEYPVTGDGGFDPEGRREIYQFEQPYDNHNGGDLRFGPDGYLYIFTGDGGFVADPQRRALDLAVPHGKVLRIDPTRGGDQTYLVPADNPFVGVDGALDKIWAYGLRNPWRASFDRLTGDLWIGDVGDFALEEINVGWADQGGGRGLSYGWSAFEGTERFNEDQSADGHVAPFFEYAHGELGCSITGGEVYRGQQIDHLFGWYVFADFCSGLIWALEVTPDRTPGRQTELAQVPFPVSATAGNDGEIYVVSIEGGVYPLVPDR
jgi:glucose/arabinose dehydrogenase